MLQTSISEISTFGEKRGDGNGGAFVGRNRSDITRPQFFQEGCVSGRLRGSSRAGAGRKAPTVSRTPNGSREQVAEGHTLKVKINIYY